MCGHSVSTLLYLVWVRFVSSCTLQVKNTVPVLPPKQQVQHKSNTHHHVKFVLVDTLCMCIFIHYVSLYSASVSVEEFRSDVAHALLEFRLLQALKEKVSHTSWQSTMASILLSSLCTPHLMYLLVGMGRRDGRTR